MASLLDLNLDCGCPVCTAVVKGELLKANQLVGSTAHEKCQAVYFVVKHYLQHLTDFAHDGHSLSSVWKLDDVQTGPTRKSVFGLLETLFKHGSPVNVLHGEELPLVCAVGTHDADLVKMMLEYGADTNMKIPGNKMNSIALAIILDDDEMLKLLLSYGARVNEACCGRLTPLQLSMNKSVQVSRLLLQNGADVQQVMRTQADSQDVFVTSPPLIHAVEMNNLFLASLLLRHGEDINQWYGDCSNSPIHFAILNGNIDMLKLLILYGANLNKRNGRGHTPLGIALHYCKGNDIKNISETLLAAGCSRKKGSMIEVFRKHFPPLHIAAFLGTPYHLDIIRFLVETSTQCKRYRSTSDYTSVTSEGGSSCKFDPKLRRSLSNSERTTDLMLTEHQEFINMQALDKSTALYMAVRGGNSSAAKYLHKQGADPYVGCCQNETLLHAAVLATKKDLHLLKFVLQFKLDVNAFNEDGNTCLMLAARNSSVGECRLLLEHGALLNLRDSRCGETALSSSVYFGFDENAALLLRCGADPEVPDSKNTNAVYWAIYNCREQALCLLIEAGAKFTKSDLTSYPKNIKIMRDPKMRRYLQSVTEEPRSLQHWCRLSVRTRLIQRSQGLTIMPAVEKLPLPQKLKNYLALIHSGK